MENPTKQSDTSKYIIPLSIIVAGALVAGAIYFSRSQPSTPATNSNPSGQARPSGDIRKIDSTDHVLGDVSAPIVIVEYSDAQCPFCQRFHETMNRVMDQYGKNGQVAWIYRHMPLDQLHPDARRRAIGLECAASLGGNQKFWQLLDEIFATQQTTSIPQYDLSGSAVKMGIDKAAFDSCLQSTQFAKRVQDDESDAVQAGGRGTPFNVLVLSKDISGDAKKYIANLQLQVTSDVIDVQDDRHVRVSGALPLNMMQGIIDALLK